MVARNRFYPSGNRCFSCLAAYRLFDSFTTPEVALGAWFTYENCCINQVGIQFTIDHEDLDWPLWQQEYERTLKAARVEAQRAWETLP